MPFFNGVEISGLMPVITDGVPDFLKSITNGGTDFSSFFVSKTWLTECPDLDTSLATNTSRMFYGCTNLVKVPKMDLEKVENLSYMFYGCSQLTELPSLNIPNAKNLSSLFYGCKELASIGGITLGSAETLSGMYLGRTKLPEFPEMDTSTVKNFSDAFRSEAGVYNTVTKSMPTYDTSKATSTSYMCYGLRGMSTLPDFDLRNVESARNMFQESHFVTIPNLIMPKCTIVSEMLVGCEKLETIGAIDWSSVTTISSNTFYRCHKLKNVTWQGTFNASINLSYAKQLTAASIVSLFNVLADRTSETTVFTVTLGSTLLNKLTAEQKQIALKKGWSLA